MEFGNIMFLWGLPAVLLPLALHLFFKRRKAKVKFSTLMFFQRREKFLSYRRRLLELLLLALRMLAILLLVLALSRIFFKKFNFISGVATGAELVVDDTISMQARLDSGMTAFECAKRKAEETLNTLSGSDRAGLVWVSGRRGEELSSDREKLSTALRQATVTGAGGSLHAAVRAAAEKLRASPGLNREIYVFSDFRTSTDKQTLAEIAGKGIRVFVLALPAQTENLAVKPVVLDNAPKAVGRALNIPFAISNQGANERQVNVILEIDGKEVQRRSLTVSGRGEATGAFVYMPEKSGWLSGDVRIDDGAVELDNRAFFAFKVGGGLKLLLAADVGSKLQDPLAFVKAALDPIPGRSINGFNAVTVDPVAIDTVALSDAQALVLALSTPLPGRCVTAINEWLRRGGVLLTLPPDDKVALYANLAQTCGAANPYLGTLQGKGSNGLTFNAPLTTFNELMQLDLLRWRQMAGLKVGGNVKTLAESQGKALLTMQEIERGRWLAAGFNFSRESSNWPLLRSFPVALTAIFNQFCGLAVAPQTVTCGPIQEIAARRNEVTYTTTWGTSGKLNAERGKVMFNEALWPGIVRMEGATGDVMVVNAATEENKDETASPAAIAGRLATIIDPGSDLVVQVRQFRQGTELSGYLLLLLLLVLAVEFVLGLNYSRPAVPEVATEPEAGTGGQNHA